MFSGLPSSQQAHDLPSIPGKCHLFYLHSRTTGGRRVEYGVTIPHEDCSKDGLPNYIAAKPIELRG